MGAFRNIWSTPKQTHRFSTISPHWAAYDHRHTTVHAPLRQAMAAFPIAWPVTDVLLSQLIKTRQ
jgi:hypothetical protein